MLVFRNSICNMKVKFPIFKSSALFLSDFPENTDKTNENKSLVEKLDLMIKKAEHEMTLKTKEPIPNTDDIHERPLYTEAISTPLPKKKISKEPQKITSQLTPWTMSNLLKPLDLANLPSRKSNSTTPPKSFASLFRQSTLVQLGNFENMKVIGVVFEVVGKDLYIDFGGKFYCVCKQPDEGEKFVRGSLVRILLKDMELTGTFMLDKVATTVLEADAILLGGVSSVNKEDIQLLFTPL